MSSFRRWSLGTWAAAGFLGAMFAACVIAPEDVHGPCKADIDCPDDGSPCTKEVCMPNGFCDRTSQDLPFGNTGCDDKNPCTEDVCQSGACAHQPSDTPPNDGNECTKDTCVNGVAQHTAVSDDTICGAGGGLKCSSGKCACKNATECGMSTECLQYQCTDGACSSMTLDQGVAVTDKAKGDCLKQVCDGKGVVVAVPDQTDPPADMAPGDCKKKACDDQGNVIDADDQGDVPADDSNVCTQEACNGGTPVLHKPVMDGNPCGGAAVCGPAVGGGYETVPGDACAAGVCAKPAAQSCGLFKCKGDNSACLAACQADGDCIAGTHCNLVNNACEPVVGTGKPCAMANECASNICKDGVCCNLACDGLCEACNIPGKLGLCGAIAGGMDPDNECAGTEACNGAGACAKPQAGPCAVDADCLSGFCRDGVCCNSDCAGSCNRCDIMGSLGQCGPVGLGTSVSGCTGNMACDGNGSCKVNQGQSCGGNAQCLTGFCQDGVCCNSACGGACAVCNLAGSVGTCTNIPSGQQVGGCNGMMACDGMNVCKKVNGQTCSAATDCASGFCPDEGPDSKYCCNAPCTETCKSCRADKTGGGGMNGVCGFIPVKTDPDMECSGCNMASGHGCCSGTGTCVP